MNAEMRDSYKVDKSTWARGEWDNEPDRVDFRHAGLPCLVLRQPRLGHFCGYVGVPPGHPLYGRTWMDVEDDIQIHGGLSYSKECDKHICHVPEAGEADAVWWFGFDCAHGGDIVPGMTVHDPNFFETFSELGDSYKNVAWVRAETERLADQVAAVAA